MSEQKPEIVTPVIHFNGTSACELVRVRDAAYDALQAALDAMKAVAPNGRDYYPEPGRLEKAEAQHRRRCRVLADLAAEIDEEIGLINGGQNRGVL